MSSTCSNMDSGAPAIFALLVFLGLASGRWPSCAVAECKCFRVAQYPAQIIQAQNLPCLNSLGPL